MGNIVVEKVWLTDTAVWIRTTDGKGGLRAICRVSKTEICHTRTTEQFHIK